MFRRLLECNPFEPKMSRSTSIACDSRGNSQCQRRRGASSFSPMAAAAAGIARANPGSSPGDCRKPGLATLLIDLLTESEAQDREKVFDIPLLADRVVGAARWLAANPPTAGLPVGAFGASTGGGAALVAAATCPDVIGCVVSRGGRPDLAEQALPAVRCPTLLIVGGEDTEVLALNQAAQDRMTADCELAVVPGATHLFEEPGTLEQVADLAADWFTSKLTSREEG